MKKVFLLLTVALCCTLSVEAQVAPPPAPTNKELEDFAGTILPYAVGDRFHKWTAPPRISLHGKAVTYKPFVEQFIADIAGTLQGLPNVTPILIEDNVTTADILFIISDEQAALLHRQRERTPSNWQWHASWNPDNSLRRFVIYASDKTFKNPLDTNERRIIYSLLCKSFGISGDRPFPIISIWGKFNEGTEESALWENDKKLIRFAYQYVPNNASKSDIKALFRKYWIK